MRTHSYFRCWGEPLLNYVKPTSLKDYLYYQNQFQALNLPKKCLKHPIVGSSLARNISRVFQHCWVKVLEPVLGPTESYEFAAPICRLPLGVFWLPAKWCCPDYAGAPCKRQNNCCPLLPRAIRWQEKNWSITVQQTNWVDLAAGPCQSLLWSFLLLHSVMVEPKPNKVKNKEIGVMKETESQAGFFFRISLSCLFFLYICNKCQLIPPSSVCGAWEGLVLSFLC